MTSYLFSKKKKTLSMIKTTSNVYWGKKKKKKKVLLSLSSYLHDFRVLGLLYRFCCPDGFTYLTLVIIEKYLQVHG